MISTAYDYKLGTSSIQHHTRASACIWYLPHVNSKWYILGFGLLCIY